MMKFVAPILLLIIALVTYFHENTMVILVLDSHGDIWNTLKSISIATSLSTTNVVVYVEGDGPTVDYWQKNMKKHIDVRHGVGHYWVSVVSNLLYTYSKITIMDKSMVVSPDFVISASKIMSSWEPCPIVFMGDATTHNTGGKFLLDYSDTLSSY